MKKISYQIPVSVSDGTQENQGIRLADAYVVCEDSELDVKLDSAKSRAYNGVYTVEDIPVSVDEVRSKRDKLLADTDWTQVLDAPIDAATREAYRVYRQALRDIPEQEGFPDTIIWPELPAVTKADPDPVDTAVDTMLGGETA